MNKHIEILIQLCKDNPELEVFTMTDIEVCCNDDFRYWKGQIESVEKNIYFENNDGIFIGESIIKDYFLDNVENSGDETLSQLSFEEKIKLVDNDFNMTNFKEAIFIFIGV